MGTTLTGTTPANTYDSLIKVTDNGPLSGTAKYLSDGLGNDSALALSTSKVLIGNTGVSAINETLNVTGAGIAIEQTDGGVTTMLGAFGSADTILGAYTNNDVVLRTNNIERMRITSAGNVAIGATGPSGTEFAQLYIGADNTIMRGGGDLNISNNGYYRGGWKRVNTGAASLAYQYGGAFDFYTAPSSTADAPISWVPRVKIDNDGNVGIGTASPSHKLDTRLTTNTDASQDIARFAANNLSGQVKTLDIIYQGSDNKINLRTNAVGTDPVIAVNVGASEVARFTTNGLTFNGDTAAANALDDYEEGTWSPQVYYQNATDQANATNVTQVGTYTKIGRLVTITCTLQWTITGSPANDNIGVKNLPFTSTSGADLVWFGACQFGNAGSYPTDGYKVRMDQNQSLLLFYDDRSDSGNYGDEIGASGTKTVRFSFTYSA